MSSKKILITAGGTGGHIYPAQGLAQQLVRQLPSHEILFVAGGLNTSRYFDRSLFPYKEVACSPLIVKNPIKGIKGIYNLFKGVKQSLKIIQDYCPDVVVGFGSYYTISTLLAAKLARIPIVLHEANSIPGKANKWFAPYVAVTGVHFPETMGLLKGQSVEVGLPLREGYVRGIVSKESAKRYFQLEEDLPILLIFGGSQGARGINQIVQEWVAQQSHTPIQCIHLTGDESSVDALSALYRSRGIRACVKPFEKQMNLAWEAADFFIGRSGAATIAEAMEFGVPGLLVPFPFAAEQHQDHNAAFLANEVGGATMVLEKNFTPQVMQKAIKEFLDPRVLNEKRRAIESYTQNPDRLSLCQLVLRIANK